MLLLLWSTTDLDKIRLCLINNRAIDPTALMLLVSSLQTDIQIEIHQTRLVY